MASRSSKGKGIVRNTEEKDSAELHRVKQTVMMCNFVRAKIKEEDRWTAADHAKTSLFANQLAAAEYLRLERAPVLSERGITSHQPFGDYIKKMRWQSLCAAPLSLATKALITEFFANLPYAQGSMVYVRGKYVNISPEAINKSFAIPDVGVRNGYTYNLENSVDPEEMGRILLKSKAALPLGCQFVNVRELNDQAWTWFMFITTSLMPQLSVANATLAQLKLIYTIMRGETVNVGMLIHDALCHSELTSGDTPFMFFPNMIEGWCCFAEVDIDAVPSIVIPPGEHLRPQLRRQRQ